MPFTVTEVMTGMPTFTFYFKVTSVQMVATLFGWLNLEILSENGQENGGHMECITRRGKQTKGMPLLCVSYYHMSPDLMGLNCYQHHHNSASCRSKTHKHCSYLAGHRSFKWLQDIRTYSSAESQLFGKCIFQPYISTNKLEGIIRKIQVLFTLSLT